MLLFNMFILKIVSCRVWIHAIAFYECVLEITFIMDIKENLQTCRCDHFGFPTRPDCIKEIDCARGVLWQRSFTKVLSTFTPELTEF